MAGGNVEPGYDGVLGVPVEPTRSDPAGNITVIPASPVTQCRSPVGHSKAGPAVGPGQSSQPLWPRAAHQHRAASPHLGPDACHHSTGPGHGPQGPTSRNHYSASYRHVQDIWGWPTVPLESGWLVWTTLGQKEPRAVQGLGSSLPPCTEAAEQCGTL